MEKAKPGTDQQAELDAAAAREPYGPAWWSLKVQNMVAEIVTSPELPVEIDGLSLVLGLANGLGGVVINVLENSCGASKAEARNLCRVAAGELARSAIAACGFLETFSGETRH